jgi:enoyl-CoA hydratase
MGNIHLTRDGACVTLELSNASRANALDSHMLAQLGQHLSHIEADSSVRLLLLRGRANGIFCAGADIRDWATLTPQAFGSEWLTFGNLLFERLSRLPCLTVSLIEGACFGGGLELALCTDMRIATSAATFCFPEVGIGAFPGWLGGPRLAAVIGRGRALEMVLLGNSVTAAQALSFGLINQLVIDSALEASILALQQRVPKLSASAVATAKGAFFANDPISYHETAGIRLRASADAAEGIQAFFEKRAPYFE